MGAAYDLLNLKHGVLMLRYFVEAGLATVAASPAFFSPRCGPSGAFLAMAKAEYYDEDPRSTAGWRSLLPSTIGSLSRANILYVSVPAQL